MLVPLQPVKPKVETNWQLSPVVHGFASSQGEPTDSKPSGVHQCPPDPGASVTSQMFQRQSASGSLSLGAVLHRLLSAVPVHPTPGPTMLQTSPVVQTLPVLQGEPIGSCVSWHWKTPTSILKQYGRVQSASLSSWLPQFASLGVPPWQTPPLVH